VRCDDRCSCGIAALPERVVDTARTGRPKLKGCAVRALPTWPSRIPLECGRPTLPGTGSPAASEVQSGDEFNGTCQPVAGADTATTDPATPVKSVGIRRS